MLSRNPTVEKYTLRYAVGTVTGAIIILLGSYVHSPALVDRFCCCFPENSFLGIAGILLLGFSYCFIASCPLYVMHMSRFLLDEKSACGNVGGEEDKTWGHCIVQNLYLIPLTTIALFILLSIEPKYIILIQVFTLILFISFVILISYSAFKCPQEIFKYYKKLCEFRSQQNENASAEKSEPLPGNQWCRYDKSQDFSKLNAEIIDSYQGLRENGNAFAIIVMQIFLYFSWSAIDSLLNASGIDDMKDKIPVYLGFAAIWVLPGWFGMLTARKMEAHFINRKPDSGNI